MNQNLKTINLVLQKILCSPLFLSRKEVSIMFKPHTTEQGRVDLFLKERFMLEQCLVSPISCSALLLEDQNGCKFAFAYQENDVRQIEIPAPPDREEVRAF